MSLGSIIDNELSRLTGYIIIVDSEKYTGYRNSILILNPNSILIIDATSLKNPTYFRMDHPTYDLKHLDGITVPSAELGRLAFRFKHPNRQIVVQADDCCKLSYFLQVFRVTIVNSGLHNNEVYCFKLPFDQFTSITDNSPIDIPNISILSTLLLENIILPAVPAVMDPYMPVSYLSLTGSSFGSMHQQNSFWHWAMINISETLICLEMNSMGLKIVPVDIMFFRNLQALSLANNELTRIPHFIGELDQLKFLYVNSNMLQFLPGCLRTSLFVNINVCDNNYKDLDIIPTNPHIFINEVRNPTIKALRDISFDLIIKNRVQLSSQYIPIGLQNMFHNFSRCRICHAIVYSYNANETFEYGCINTSNIIKHNSPIAWQYFECCFKCNPNDNKAKSLSGSKRALNRRCPMLRRF